MKKYTNRILAVVICALLMSFHSSVVQAASILTFDTRMDDSEYMEVNTTIRNGETKYFGNMSTGQGFLLHAGTTFDLNLYFVDGANYFEFGLIDEKGNQIPSLYGFITDKGNGWGTGIEIENTGRYRIYVTSYNPIAFTLNSITVKTFKTPV